MKKKTASGREQLILTQKVDEFPKIGPKETNLSAIKHRESHLMSRLPNTNFQQKSIVAN